MSTADGDSEDGVCDAVMTDEPESKYVSKFLYTGPSNDRRTPQTATGHYF